MTLVAVGESGNNVAERLYNAGLSESTQETYHLAVTDYMQFVAGTNPLQQCAAKVKLYRQQLIDSGMSASTINKHLSAVRRFYNVAVDLGVLSAAEFRTLESIKNVKSNGTPFRRWVEMDVLRDLLTMEETSLSVLRDKAMIVLLALGLRREETTNVKWNQLQKLDGTYFLMDVWGKGSKIRTVPVPVAYVEILERWRGDSSSDSYILTNIKKNGEKGDKLSKRSVNYLMNKYEVAPHEVRRGVATHVYEQTKDIDAARALLGHEQRQTTELYLKETKIQGLVSVIGVL